MADRTIVVRLRADVAGFKQGMKEASAASKDAAFQFDRNGKRIESSSQRVVRSAELNGAAWTQAGTAITAFGAVGAVALGLSAKAAIDWESAWAGVLKTVDGTGEQLMVLEDTLRGMALELPASASEIAGVAEAAGQLGVKVQDVAAFTRVMIDLGETTNLTANDAATALARISNIMGTSADDVDRMGAVIVDLGNNSATTEREIVELATRLAAAGKQAGLSESDIFAFGAALTSVGVESEAGGTAMSKVFTSIADATRDGGEKLQSFAKIAGVSATAFKQAFQDDGAQAIAMFVTGMGDLANSGQSTTQVFEDLELTDQRLTRAILSLGSAGTLLNDELAIGNRAWEENTALIEEANKRYDTTEAKVKIAKNAINDAAITIGEDLLPILAKMAEGVASAAEAFANLPDPVREVLTGMGGLVTVVALLAGGTLLLAPRLVEAYKALVFIKSTSPGAVSGLKSVGAAAGIAAVAYLALVAAGEALSAVTVKTASIEVITSALLDLAAGADVASTKIAELVDYGKGDAFLTGGKTLESISDAFAEVEGYSKGIGKAQAAVADFLHVTNLTSGSLVQARETVSGIDKALASLVQSGAPEDASAAIAKLGISADDVRDHLPAYTAALADVDNQQRLATDSSVAFTEAQQAEADAVVASAEAMQKLTDAVALGNAAFIDGYGAYQSVIDANVAEAQAQADALNAANDAANDARRKSDADTVDYVSSKWEDFYDGQTVSIDDYIAKLQEQADAQTNFENNLNALNDRVKKDILPDQQGVAFEFLNDLAASGPEGAAQAALLKDASAAELRQVVDLWAQGGKQAAGDFATEFIAGQQPTATVRVDTTAGDATYRRWLDGLPTTIGVKIAPDLGRIGTGRPENVGQFATGGIASTPQVNIWGEGRGREAFVPLDLPLSQVDPSVRGLAAYARGDVNSYATGGVAGGYGELYAPHVITVPVESRFETHAPVNVYTSASTIDGITDEARRRTNSWAGSRG